MLGIALGAGLVWLLIFTAVALTTRIPPRARPSASPGLAGTPAALVNLVTTQGRLDGAAYAATVLDLGSRGGLVITEPAPGRLECELPPRGQGASGRGASGLAPGGLMPGGLVPGGLVPGGLAAFEDVVLGEARRQAAHGPLPFEVLAESAAADAPGVWASFEKAVREAGRQRGLTRPRLSGLVLTGLLLGAAGVALLLFLAEHSRNIGLAAPVFAGTVVAVVCTSFVGSLTRQDRLTQAGADLAAQATSGNPGGIAWSPGRGDRAAGTAPARGRGRGARPGPAGRRRAGAAVRRPARRPAIRQPARPPAPGRLVLDVRGLAAGADPQPGDPAAEQPVPAAVPGRGAVPGRPLIGALMRAPGEGPSGVLVVPLLVAIALAAFGLAALSRYLALPAKAAFTAQVVARWEEDFERGDDTTVRVYRYAVDDGQQTWCGEVSQPDFARIRIGELVQVQAEPRSRTLTAVEFRTPAPAPW